jgi:hypothetical protein
MRRWCFKCGTSADVDGDRCLHCSASFAKVYSSVPNAQCSEPAPSAELSNEDGIPMIDLASLHIPRDVIELVPFDLAHELRVVPVNRTARAMVVALADPTDTEAIARVREATGLDVLVAVATPGAVSAALWKYYRAVK